jgi:6-phosphogluconate dehydrogenase
MGMIVCNRWMCSHLLSAGYPVHVYNRTKAKCDPLVQHGAVVCDSPAYVIHSHPFHPFSVTHHPLLSILPTTIMIMIGYIEVSAKADHVFALVGFPSDVRQVS